MGDDGTSGGLSRSDPATRPVEPADRDDGAMAPNRPSPRSAPGAPPMDPVTGPRRLGRGLEREDGGGTGRPAHLQRPDEYPAATLADELDGFGAHDHPHGSTLRGAPASVHPPTVGD